MAFRPFHTDVGSLLESCFFSFPAWFFFATLISLFSVYLACLYKALSPPPVGVLFGQAKLFEFCTEPRFVIVKC